jgi:dolichyl-phosphate beta-glucosyltransferase
MNPYLSVIIPCYNEERRITKTLEVIYTYLGRQNYPWEILIVLDGVTDRTLDKVLEFAAGREHIRWIDRKNNRGKGYSIREGMMAARGSIQLFTDADNSTDISHFDKMRPLFDAAYDVVICSRDSKDAKGAQQAVLQPFYKRMLGNFGNIFIQAVAVPGIWDTQCGFKAFTEQATRKVFPLAQIDRYGFDIEILALARRSDLKIGIVPAFWIDDAETHLKLADYLATFFEVVKVRWKLIRGGYENHDNLSAGGSEISEE